MTEREKVRPREAQGRASRSTPSAQSLARPAALPQARRASRGGVGAWSRPPYPAHPAGHWERGRHVSGAGGSERASGQQRFRSEACAELPASLGGGGGGDRGCRGIRKSTPCRVCTRAGKGPLGQAGSVTPGQSSTSPLQRGRAAAAMHQPSPGSGARAPTSHCLWA